MINIKAKIEENKESNKPKFRLWKIASYYLK